MRILLVHAGPGDADAERLREVLGAPHGKAQQETSGERVHFVRASSLAEARSLLAEGDAFDLVLLEPALLLAPDTPAAPDTPGAPDTHEIQRLNRELARSEGRLRSVFEGAAAGIAVTRIDGTFEYANPAYLKMLGYTLGELQELDFPGLTHPQDRARNMELYRELLDGRRKSFVLEKRNLRKDGTSIWVRVSASLLPGEWGEATHAVAVTEDVTERRTAEERARSSERLLAIAGSMARIGGWSVDLDQDTVYWSDEVCDIHELPRGSRVPVSEGIDFYAPEWRPVIREAFTRCAEEGVPWDLDLQIITARGRRLWVRAIGEPVRDAQGRIQAVQGAFQDISRQKESEEELRRLGEEARTLAGRLTRTLDSMTEAFYLLDRDWRMTFVNPVGEALAQRSQEELVGAELWEVFPDVVGTAIEENYRTAVETGEPRLFEYHYPEYDLWVDVRAYPSSDGLAVYMRDITAAKKAERWVEEAQDRFRLVARLASDVIFDWDLATNQVWWGDGLRETFGIEPTSFGGQGGDWRERVHPEDRDRVADGLAAALDSGAGEWEDRLRLRRGEGEFAWVESRGAILRDAEGRAVRMVGGISDVTDRYEATEQLRQQAELLDRAQDAILVRDLDHRILYANQGADRLYGWSRKELVGSSERDLLPVEPGAFDRALEALLAEGEWAGEFAHRRKDGATVTVECRWSLQRDEGGAPLRILSIGTDVTERKDLMAQFLRAQRLESIGTLAGGIAHDLNNVLAPILLSIGLLEEEIEDPGLRDTLATISASAERGAAMVRQVLAFARGVEVGDLDMDLERIVEEIARVVRDSFPKSIRLETRVPPSLWRPRGDPTQLHQVLLNLAVNARDAMPSGGLLSITAENVEVRQEDPSLAADARPGQYVRVSVTDTGSGMPAEVLDKIFDPFFTTKEVGRGTGLGLSTVSAIVRGHGGFVDVSSEPGQGSTFAVYFPVARTAPEAEDSDTGAPFPAPPRGRGEFILVVDDEDAVRKMTRRTLEAHGYHVVTATDGADALATYGRMATEINLVLTDVMMPVMDGRAVIRALREVDPSLPIIAASGLVEPGELESTNELGATHFLHKPYTSQALLEAVHEALARHAADPD